jgi:hypothetical protein
LVELTYLKGDFLMGYASTPGFAFNIAGQVCGVGGALYNAKVHLYVNNLDPIPSNVLADFSEATFTGYAAATLASVAPYYDPAQKVNMAGVSQLFVATAAMPNNLIYGYYITDSTDTYLWFAELFQGGPISIAAIGDGVQVIPILQFGDFVEPLAPQTGE